MKNRIAHRPAPAAAREPAAMTPAVPARAGEPAALQTDPESSLRRARLLGHDVQRLPVAVPRPPAAPSQGAAGRVQRTTVEAVVARLRGPRERRVFQNLIILQMFEEKKATPAELLDDSSAGEWEESVAVWAQPANAAALERYAFLLSKAAAEGKLLNLKLTLSQVSALDKKLTDLGKGAQAADFVLLAAVKGLDSATIVGMVDTNVAVEARGYPYPFASAQEFTTFKQGVTQLVAQWELPTDDLRVQGSSLRKTTPGDVDLACMVGDQAFAELGQRMIAGTGMDKIKKDIAREMKKGKISGFNFDRPQGTAGSFTTNLVGLMPRLDEHHIQPTLAIILRGSSMDLTPFLRF